MPKPHEVILLQTLERHKWYIHNIHSTNKPHALTLTNFLLVTALLDDNLLAELAIMNNVYMRSCLHFNSRFLRMISQPICGRIKSKKSSKCYPTCYYISTRPCRVEKILVSPHNFVRIKSGFFYWFLTVEKTNLVAWNGSWYCYIFKSASK